MHRRELEFHDSKLQSFILDVGMAKMTLILTDVSELTEGSEDCFLERLGVERLEIVGALRLLSDERISEASLLFGDREMQDLLEGDSVGLAQFSIIWPNDTRIRGVASALNVAIVE